VAFDRPGHGHSERHIERSSPRSSGTASREALRQLSLEQPIIDSRGGAVALAMALEGQEDLAGLVLLAPVPPGDTISGGHFTAAAGKLCSC
jgi:pimeloyl-ACP methyl ester carboxylesterase